MIAQDKGKLLVVQINLHHCKAATDDLMLFMTQKDIDIGLIQEPYLLKGKILGLRSRDFNIYHPHTEGKLRACIVAKKSINLFLLTPYSNEDLTVVSCELKDISLLLSSAYMPYEEDGPPPEAVRTLAVFAKSRGRHLVIGCDANGHHIQWGCRNNNNRGESIFEFLLSTNLIICNKGNAPTFQNRVREEILDLTLASDSVFNLVEDWRVSTTCSFSDHNRILFTLNLRIDRPKPFRNPQKVNWEKFSNLVARKLAPPSATASPSVTNIEKSVDDLVSVLKESFDNSCPISRPRRKTSAVWWTPELRQLRVKTRKLFNRAKISKRIEDWDNYKASFNEYKYSIRTAKLRSWQTFCESIEVENEAARLRKVLSKDPCVPGYIQKLDGSWTESSKESLELLIETHFPGCKDPETATPFRAAAPCDHTDEEVISTIVKEDKVAWAINSFKPYKSAGPDGIIPAMLQQSLCSVVPHLVSIFSDCLRTGYTPSKWKEVRVVFIPKAGKPNHSTAKDYRPISLSSFLLKTLERLIDLHIKGMINFQNLCEAQHAYLKGKSVESALHCVVREIEHSLSLKEYTMAAFLDIEGAFNNVNTEAIEEALIDLEVNRYIAYWVENMLNSRIINSAVGPSSMRRLTTRGTPQGGVLSPTLWLLIVNKILKIFTEKRIKIVAYADDLVILIKGKYLSTISELMESALKELSRWAEQKGLGVNPRKTELVLFTRKRKIPNFTLPKLDGTTIVLSSEAKYLGVILDSKLTWKRNVEERMKKGLNALYACKRTFGKRWGLQPRIIHWMYTAIIRPIISYGSLVWWTATEIKSYLNELYKVQRLAALCTTGVMRSAPQAGLDMILHLLPLDLFIKGSAAKGALRLRESNMWKHTNYGHAKILNKVKTMGEKYNSESFTATSDYLIPYNDFNIDIPILYPGREDWESEKVINDHEITIYTDGSKMDIGTGAGFYSEALQKQESFRLPEACSVFQAEVLAIEKAALSIKDSHIPPSDITIFVDSQAALKSIGSNTIKSKAVRKCRDSLITIRHHKVKLCWVPGHSNVEGNEKADELARRGSALSISEADTSILPPIGRLYNIIDNIIEREANASWLSREDCAISRALWPELNKMKTKTLLALDRSSIRTLTGVITGHCAIGVMLRKWNAESSDLCRSCGDEEEVESIQHLLCRCPALQERRLRTLGSRFFGSTAEVAELRIKDLLGFIKSSSWFKDRPGTG